MKKVFSWLIKIIPLITIWQGLTSGGARLNPFLDTAKVALTQYEVIQIVKLVSEDVQNNDGKVISPKEFPDFVRDQFHSQYSVLAREITGNKKHDHAIDIWGKNFELLVNDDISHVKIASPGPDRILSSKDDIAADFKINRPSSQLAKTEPKNTPVDAEAVSQTELVTEENRAPAEESEFDEEGFNRDGLNRDGYDRDGYDMNGMHRDEKEISASP